MSSEASLQSAYDLQHAETEREDLEPAHWWAPGGLGDPTGEIHDVTVDSLQEAALRGDVFLLRRYLDTEAPVNAPLHVAGSDEYFTLLHVIAGSPSLPNGPAIVAELVGAKANPNARSTLGSTPLMFACFHKNVQIAEALLECEADCEAEDDHGKTALRYAVCLESGGAEESAELVELLEGQGGDLDHGGTRSPMAEAVLHDNRNAVTRLLELGATSDGLVYALAEKSLQVVKELAAGGANPFACNEKGQSCWAVAEERGSEEILECLDRYICEIERSRNQHLKLKPFAEEEVHWTHKGKEHCQWLISGSRYSTRAKNVKKRLPEEDVADDVSPVLTSNQLWRYQVKLILENPVVQAIVTTNLVLALFLPDFWVILAMAGDEYLDNALVIILCIFVLEFLANISAHGDAYLYKYAFWTDVVGILSVPWDHSLVADNFVDLFESSGLARVTKFAKLSARAVRLSRLAKLLRFYPGAQEESQGDRGQGPAQGISMELMTNLSIKVALLIIILVLLLPIIDFFRFPPDDYSLDAWAFQIHYTSKSFPEDARTVVEDMRAFYQALNVNYFPFQVNFQYANGTGEVIAMRNAQAPMREEDVLIIQKDDTVVRFNFRAPKLADAWLNVLIMIGVIITMLVSAAGVSSAVSHTVLSPIQDLLEIVHSTAIRIFEAVELMAIYFVKDYSNQQWRELVTEDVNRNRFSHEVQLLTKVLKKLDLLTIIANAKHPVDEFEQLGDGPAAFLQDYATYAAVRHRLTLPRPEGELEMEQMEHAWLMQSIGMELSPVDVSRADFNSWALHIADLNAAQRSALARCLVVMYDTAPGFPDERAVSLQKYKCHCEFIKVLESQYEDEQAVTYHNWIHAVDVAFSLRHVFYSIQGESYFAMHERFALMVAAFAHDLGHFGVSNGFLMQSNHEFSITYNDLSCLQNLACARLFRLTSEPDCSIFLNFDRRSQRDLRQIIIFAILHTDPLRHPELMTQLLFHYENRRELFELQEQLEREEEEEADMPSEVLVKARKEVEDYLWNADVKYTLRNALLHMVDSSYCLKVWEVCSHWANALFEEFFKQGDLERNKVPMQPLNDRARTNVAFAQTCYTMHIIVPQTKMLVSFLPKLRHCKKNMWTNLWRWIAKWKNSHPDHEELQRVLQTVSQLHDVDLPEEALEELNAADLSQSESGPPVADHHMSRRMSVRSLASHMPSVHASLRD